MKSHSSTVEDLRVLAAKYPWLKDRYYAFLQRARCAGIPLVVPVDIYNALASGVTPNGGLTEQVSILLQQLQDTKFRTTEVNLLLADMLALAELDGARISTDSFLRYP